MVATNAFGLGVDKADIRCVYHYHVPGSLEAYAQEAGRGGRDGKPARCVLFFSPDDVAIQEYFLKGTYPTRRQVRAVYALLGLALFVVRGGAAAVSAGHQRVAVRPGGRRDAAREPQLREEVADVASDRLLADPEPCGDHAVGQAGGHEAQHFHLARRESPGVTTRQLLPDLLDPRQLGPGAQVPELRKSGVQLCGRAALVPEVATSEGDEHPGPKGLERSFELPPEILRLAQPAERRPRLAFAE
jgi:hypothetical protein